MKSSPAKLKKLITKERTIMEIFHIGVAPPPTITNIAHMVQMMGYLPRTHNVLLRHNALRKTSSLQIAFTSWYYLNYLESIT